jgi:hypothetical protein
MQPIAPAYRIDGPDALLKLSPAPRLAVSGEVGRLGLGESCARPGGAYGVRGWVCGHRCIRRGMRCAASAALGRVLWKLLIPCGV